MKDWMGRDLSCGMAVVAEAMKLAAIAVLLLGACGATWEMISLIAGDPLFGVQFP